MLNYKYKLDGGSLTSIMVSNEERLFILDESIWSGQDNVIFPFVARLKNEKYMVDGKEYSMKIHGIAKYSNFKLIAKSENSDIIYLTSNEETLKHYPYKFELYVTYTRNNNILDVEYKVKNIDDKIMYFGIGGHPAIRVNYEDNDTKGNYVLFDKKTIITYYELKDDGSFITRKKTLGEVGKIEVDKAFFRKYKTLICDNNFNHLTLKRKDGRRISFRFHSKYLSIWSKPNAGDFVCIEPWDGLPDFENPNLELSKKEGINSLKPGEEYLFSYEMEFID